MELNNYLLYALLIAACIPVLDVVATWYYARGALVRQQQALEDRAALAATPSGAEPHAAADGAQALLPASAQLSVQAQRLGVGFNGRQFTYAGHVYDRASDAEAYARLVMAKSKALRASLGARKP